MMVVVDRLSKVAHFIATTYTNSTSEVGQIFIREIVRLHGVPKKIIQTEIPSSLPSFGRSCLQAWG